MARIVIVADGAARRVLPWPPEPLRFLVSHAVRGYLRIEDRFYERHFAQ